MLSLTNLLVLHSIKLAGGVSTKKCIVVPMCTGMSISLVLSTLASKNKKGKYVLWSRIDQKSCFKSIVTASLVPEVIELNFQKDSSSKDEKIQQIIDDNEDGLTTDLEALEKKILELKDEVLCVMSTTSCFAPRLPDRIIEIAKICKTHGIPHIVNNAYGLQSRKIMNQISTGSLQGRIDAFIQSTDKNYMVPVGGAIIASTNENFIDEVSQIYAGRGSMSSVMDVFITLLSLGENGWLGLLKERETLVKEFISEGEVLAKKYNEKILKTKANEISFVMTLDHFENPSLIGSKLFYRNISGPKVVTNDSKKEVCGVKFQGYGSHCNNYPHNYLTMACAIGIQKEEIKEFFSRLEKVLEECSKEKKEK
jgi:O-phospho-L-seryl-tRNASec:L-selenocysteinyl-tRNA synthase